ncbi:hypothetical protein SUDANB121_05089 [Nocardiopsis dassonvillei]|uniref:DUF488 domain-containing protein n=1 Tax=Nocardiopsis dassonvillei TaxID=2014 RepID=UPI003F57894B
MGYDIRVERVYDEVRGDPPPGALFLVDRLWPRGVRKSALEGVPWIKEAAPGTELRSWFGHDPQRFEEFARRYRAELAGRRQALEPILEAARRGPVTLLYSARDEEHNQAVVLRDHLLELLSAQVGGN